MYELTNMMIFTHKSVKMTRVNCLISAIDVELDLYNLDLIQFILVLMLWVFTLVGEKLHLLVKNYTLKCNITFTFYMLAGKWQEEHKPTSKSPNPETIEKFFCFFCGRDFKTKQGCSIHQRNCDEAKFCNYCVTTAQLL